MNETLDLTRLNRVDRRKYQKKTGTKIQGRNMPYIKAVHKSVDDYNKLREKELQQDLAQK